MNEHTGYFLLGMAIAAIPILIGFGLWKLIPRFRKSMGYNANAVRPR